jgi:hypothetical protein
MVGLPDTDANSTNRDSKTCGMKTDRPSLILRSNESFINNATPPL